MKRQYKKKIWEKKKIKEINILLERMDVREEDDMEQFAIKMFKNTKSSVLLLI